MPSPIDVTTFLLLHIVFMKLTCPQTCFCSHWCLLWFRTIEIIFQFFFGNGSTLESLLLANRRVFPSHMQFLSKSRIYRLFQRKKCFNFIRMPLIFQRWLQSLTSSFHTNWHSSTHSTVRIAKLLLDRSNSSTRAKVITQVAFWGHPTLKILLTQLILHPFPPVLPKSTPWIPIRQEESVLASWLSYLAP